VSHRITWSWYTGRWLVGCYLAGTFGTAARRGLAGASVPVTVWYWYAVVCCCVVLKGLIGKARFNSHAYIFYCLVRLNEYSCNSFEYSFNPLCFLLSLFYTHCSGAVLYYCNFFLSTVVYTELRTTSIEFTRRCC